VAPFPRARLARVGRAELALARRLAPWRWLPGVEEAARELAARLGLAPLALRLLRVQALPVEDLRAAFPGRVRFALLAEPGAGRLGCLALDAELLARVEARLPDPGAGAAGADEGLAAGLVCAGLRSLGARRPGAAGWRLAGMVEGAGALGRLLAHEACLAGAWLEVGAEGGRGWAAWLEGESSLGRRPAEPAGGPAPSWPGWLGRAPVQAARRLGSTELGAGELDALAPGDVVLFAPTAEGGDVWLQLGGQALRAQAVGPGRWRVVWLGPDEEGGEDMQAEMDPRALTPGEGGGGSGLEVGALPVRVVVEAGRLQLPVELLAGLRIGDVLTLPEPVLGPVELRAGGRLLGRGELVDVEGQRGVRVLELAGAREVGRGQPA